ncbi:MAG: aminotransferase class I/II-fold pyridoxal phosphate-dependent enzyme [Candidatus Peregrinibacteria bacterium]|nr:aminotransferase class I/II-fold pyridoxal phosphate-dependent enzyme [Candidatus Peregrinibacteria bacterium]MDZ4244456.1 aminotransferase class I/II-fold pyridoxal phosphate-dependent enzyme [Candidatus Gracilibacteria bacterium]
MKENINIALSPNSTAKDVKEAAKQLFLPWKWLAWRSGRNISKLESEFCGYFKVPYAFALNSGRESLYAILQALKFAKGDEIILQSFTCMVVVNSIVWNGLKPVYVDIDASDYNMNPDEFEKKITKRTKVVMVQHTFGVPANMKKIQEICKRRKLILIEDCAHAMGAKSNGKYVGTIGDIGFFSLGRSKVISCVSGGMIVTKNEKYAGAIKEILKSSEYPRNLVTAKNLFHPIAMECIKKLYNKGVLGKVLLVGLQKLKLLTMEVEKSEKSGEFKCPYPLRMSNALSALALYQFTKLDQFNTHRRNLAQKYYNKLKSKKGIKVIDPNKYKGAIFLRYPVLMPTRKDMDAILRKAKKSSIILGDWYASPIAPPTCAMEKTFYNDGDCKVTEDICSRVVNLPTYNTLDLKQAEKILKLF